MESCKIFIVWSRRNAFSKLAHHQYKSFPSDRFCQTEIKKSVGNQKHNVAICKFVHGVTMTRMEKKENREMMNSDT